MVRMLRASKLVLLTGNLTLDTRIRQVSKTADGLSRLSLGLRLSRETTILGYLGINQKEMETTIMGYDDHPLFYHCGGCWTCYPVKP